MMSNIGPPVDQDRPSRRRRPSDADYGTPERRRKGGFVIEGTEIPHVRMLAECRLDWYLDRGLIDESQHGKGMRFRSDFLIASRDVNGQTAPYTGCRVDGGATLGRTPDGVLDAQDRVKRALMNIPMTLTMLVVRVCGLGEWAGKRQLGNLIVGLDALTEHYERVDSARRRSR